MQIAKTHGQRRALLTKTASYLLMASDGKGAELGLFKVAVIKLLYRADERNGVPGTGGLVVK